MVTHFLTCLKHGDFFLACLKQGPSLLHCQHIPCLVGVSIDTYCSQTPQMSFWLHGSILLFFLFWVTALARRMGCFSHRSLSPSWNLKPFSSLLCVSCTSDLSVGQPTRSIDLSLSSDSLLTIPSGKETVEMVRSFKASSQETHGSDSWLGKLTLPIWCWSLPYLFPLRPSLFPCIRLLWQLLW